MDRSKATELRQLMLYTGKLVLKGMVKEDVYVNFVTLSTAMAILVFPDLAKDHSSYTHNFLHYFVVKGRALYEKEFLVHNIHSLLHMAIVAIVFKGLDNWSAFMFEN